MTTTKTPRSRARRVGPGARSRSARPSTGLRPMSSWAASASRRGRRLRRIRRRPHRAHVGWRPLVSQPLPRSLPSEHRAGLCLLRRLHHPATGRRARRDQGLGGKADHSSKVFRRHAARAHRPSHRGCHCHGPLRGRLRFRVIAAAARPTGTGDRGQGRQPGSPLSRGSRSSSLRAAVRGLAAPG